VRQCPALHIGRGIVSRRGLIAYLAGERVLPYWSMSRHPAREESSNSTKIGAPRLLVVLSPGHCTTDRRHQSYQAQRHPPQCRRPQNYQAIQHPLRCPHALLALLRPSLGLPNLFTELLQAIRERLVRGNPVQGRLVRGLPLGARRREGQEEEQGAYHAA